MTPTLPHWGSGASQVSTLWQLGHTRWLPDGGRRCTYPFFRPHGTIQNALTCFPPIGVPWSDVAVATAGPSEAGRKIGVPSQHRRTYIQPPASSLVLASQWPMPPHPARSLPKVASWDNTPVGLGGAAKQPGSQHVSIPPVTMVLGSPRAVGALASGETADPSALHLPPSHPRLLCGKSPCQRSLPGRSYCHPLLISCLTSHLRLVAGVLSFTSCIDADSVWPPRLIPLPSPLNSASRRPESLRALLATATFELGSSALSDTPYLPSRRRLISLWPDVALGRRTGP